MEDEMRENHTEKNAGTGMRENKKADADKNLKKDIRSARDTLMELIAGCFICAFSVSCFYSPKHLLAGGVTGIAQLLNYQFNLPVSVMVIVINIPLFILALIFIDKRFTLFSLIGMFALSFCLEITGGIHVEFDSALTSVALGGVLNGLGLGLIYRSEASVGGTDIISKIIQRYYSGNMAYTGLIMNFAIVGVSALIYGIDQAVLTICAMYISSQVNTYITDGIDHRRAVTIITKKPELMADIIFASLDRTVTVTKGYGAYSREDYYVLYCVISRRELAKLKRCIKTADEKAFFTITRVTGVYGHGRNFQSIAGDIV